MKKLLVVCLVILVHTAVAVGAEKFVLANRVGEPGERSFFLFSTSVGNYIVRQDGMGEFSSPNGRRRVFTLRVKGRIEQIYFLEHAGDVFICYEVDGTTFVVRMEQIKRKIRWYTAVENTGAPVIDGDAVIINATKINTADGKIIGQD